jgi:hypothetical protein
MLQVFSVLNLVSNFVKCNHPIIYKCAILLLPSQIVDYLVDASRLFFTFIIVFKKQ